jgi:glutaconate CoA-transferase, subunit A
VGAGAGGPAVAGLREVLDSVVGDGSLVAFGGGELRRKPVAAARELATLGRRDLRIATMLGSAEVELLLGAGVVAEVHSAGVMLKGLAPRWREARQTGSPHVVEWSEGTFVAALQAAALGADSFLWPSGVGTDLPTVNPWLREVQDPWSGEPVLAVRALEPDVAVIHAHGVDEHGNVYIEEDLVADELLARAARHVVVTYERLVPAEPARAAISRLFVDDTIEVPGGAAPTACPGLYDVDEEGLASL